MSTAVTFAALTESLGGHRNLRQSRLTDCPVTAITVTRCDGRNSTDVRYPPIGADVGSMLVKTGGAQICKILRV
jgi:hypothetical protein